MVTAIVTAIVIVTLVSINALCVAAEFAVIGAREGRIRTAADEGNRSARRLLGVLRDPLRLDRYISSCQLGITVTSLVLGAYSEFALAGALTSLFEAQGYFKVGVAHSVAVVGVLVGVTMLQVVLGEQVPKSLALHSAARIALVHIRDLLRLLRSWQPLERDIVRPIPFVPETMSVERVLGVMRRDKTHAVIAMDEQGGTAGLLTIKDLFEEVVGTIEEGAVDVEGRVEAFRDDDGRLHVLGTLRLDELAEVLAEEMPETIVDPHATNAGDPSAPPLLPDTAAETVSGMVLLQLGRPAQVGDTVMHGPVRLVVIEIEGRGVKQCLVEPSMPHR